LSLIAQQIFDLREVVRDAHDLVPPVHDVSLARNEDVGFFQEKD
jgi:hypothetical protein